MKISKNVYCLIFLIFFINSKHLLAKNKNFNNNSNQLDNSSYSNNNIGFYDSKLSLYFSRINGKANETLYRKDSTKISHLEWDIKNLKMLNLGFSTKYYDIFGFNIRYGHAINHGSNKARMIDSDWLKNSTHNGDLDPDGWTDRSFSKSRINFAHDFEIFSSIHFPKYEWIKFKIGIRENHIKFRDYGINYIYSDNGGFRNYLGDLNNKNLVDYQQNFVTPYIGIALDYNFYNKINTNLFANYSNQVSGQATDYHKYFNDRYRQNIEGGTFINYGFNLDSKIYKNLSFGIGFEYVYYPLKLGKLQVSDNGSKYYLSDQPIGMKSKFTIISLNLKYDLDLNSILNL